MVLAGIATPAQYALVDALGREPSYLGVLTGVLGAGSRRHARVALRRRRGAHHRRLAARAEIDALAARADAMGLAVPDLQEAWRTESMTTVTDRVDAVDAVLDDVDGLRDGVDRAGLPDPDLDIDPATDDPDDIRCRVSTVVASRDRIVDAES